MTDEVWDVARLRKQDPDAFQKLVESHQPLVLGLCQALGLKGADIDDGAADAFVAVYHALPQFRGDSELSTWLYRIAYRTILRARKNLRRTITVDCRGMKEVTPDATQTQEAAEMYVKLWETVAALEPRQAAAVELHYRRGWPVERIAMIMECPEGTVKTLLARARESLRTKLRGMEDLFRER